MERTHLDSSKKILDFGAAKGTIAKKLVDELGSENVYVYEVSDSYVNYWNPKILTENQAINIIPREWEKSFDLLISIFVMEHVSEIRKYIRQAVDFLTTEGQIFAIVPYLLTNPCDLLVSDHPNHFTKQSLMELLQSAGFSEILIADDLFRGALIVTAKLKENQMEQSKSLEENFRVLQLAEYWNIQSKILENYEIAGEGKVAIYGGGIYGLFIYSKLEHKTKIACFIDQNPFLQGERHEGIEIVSPENIPAGVDTIFVGLNPRIAVQAISNTKFNVDKSKIKIVYLSEF